MALPLIAHLFPYFCFHYLRFLLSQYTDDDASFLPITSHPLFAGMILVPSSLRGGSSSSWAATLALLLAAAAVLQPAAAAADDVDDDEEGGVPIDQKKVRDEIPNFAHLQIIRLIHTVLNV